jgi:hypothetical protein
MSEIKLDSKSFVRNLCPWTVGFRLPNAEKDIVLEAGKTIQIYNSELITLVENEDVMFVGTGNGKHARVFIENDELRKHIDFDSKDGDRQMVVDDDICKKLLEYKTMATFKKNVEETIVCNHEKHKIIEYARKNKLNDYDKIQFLVKHCGVPFNEE